MPTTSQSTDELLKQADLAMYQAKSAGAAPAFFDPAMQAVITARVALERIFGLRCYAINSCCTTNLRWIAAGALPAQRC